MIYKKVIDDKVIEILKQLIDLDIQSLYSNGLFVNDSFIESYCFSIRLENQLWINITNHVRETPNNNDYYELRIESDLSPTGIKYDEVHNALVLPFGKINLTRSKVKTIEIYNKSETYGEEELIYDVLLLFECEDDTLFMISLEERVDATLVYSSNPKLISSYLNLLSLRIKI
jgi:hypothetical protein